MTGTARKLTQYRITFNGDCFIVGFPRHRADEIADALIADGIITPRQHYDAANTICAALQETDNE